MAVDCGLDPSEYQLLIPCTLSRPSRGPGLLLGGLRIGQQFPEHFYRPRIADLSIATTRYETASGVGAISRSCRKAASRCSQISQGKTSIASRNFLGSERATS